MTAGYAAAAAADLFDRAASFLACLIDSLSRPEALLLPHERVEEGADTEPADAVGGDVSEGSVSMCMVSSKPITARSSAWAPRTSARADRDQAVADARGPRVDDQVRGATGGTFRPPCRCSPSRWRPRCRG